MDASFGLDEVKLFSDKLYVYTALSFHLYVYVAHYEVELDFNNSAIRYKVNYISLDHWLFAELLFLLNAMC